MGDAGPLNLGFLGWGIRLLEPRRVSYGGMLTRFASESMHVNE